MMRVEEGSIDGPCRRIIYENLLSRGVPEGLAAPLEIILVITTFQDSMLRKPGNPRRENLENGFFKDIIPGNAERHFDSNNERISQMPGCIIQWNRHQKFSTYVFYCFKATGSGEVQQIIIPHDLIAKVPGEIIDTANISVVSAPSRAEYFDVSQSITAESLSKVIAFTSAAAKRNRGAKYMDMEGPGLMPNSYSRKAEEYEGYNEKLTDLHVKITEAKADGNERIKNHDLLRQIEAEARSIIKNVKARFYKHKARQKLGIERN